jgi:hypothetical protein
LFDALSAAGVSFITKILGFLPDSPFLLLEDLSNTDFYTWIQFLNWFIPIGTFVSILEVWVAGICVYYVYQIALRWVKAIS